VWIAEVNLHASIDLEARMLSHLGSLIPGQRPSQLFGQGSDRARNRFAHCLSSMASKCWPVLDASFPAVTYHARQVQQHGEARRTFHQSSDRGAAEPQDEIAFPVSWHRAVNDFCRALADHDLGRDEALASTACACPRHT